MPNENGNVACDTPSLDGKCQVRTWRRTQPSTRALWMVDPASPALVTAPLASMVHETVTPPLSVGSFCASIS